MAKIAIGYDDKVRTATSITSDSAIATLPAANVGTIQISQIWKSQPVTSAFLLVDLGSSNAISVVALINTNLTAAATWRVRLSTVDATGVAGNAHDSGVIAAGADVLYKKAIRIFSAPATGRYLRVDLTDTSLTFLSVGRLAALKVFQPTYNFSPGAQITYRDFSKRFSGDDGQTWILRGSMQRGFAFSLPAITDTERNGSGEALLLAAGMNQDVLVVRDQASTNLGRDSIWGLLEELPVWTMIANNYSSIPMRVMDRL